MKNTLSLIISLCTLVSVWGQTGEHLSPLYSNPNIKEKAKVPFQHTKRASNQNRIVFTFNTLFIDSDKIFDDFSTNKMRSYDFELTDPGVTFETNFNFTVDGAYVAQLEAVRKESYNYTFDSGTNSWDSTAFPAMQVVYFSPTTWQLPVDTDTLWMRPPAALIGGVLYPDSIKADTVLVNAIDTTFYVPNKGDNEMWINHSPYINNHYALQPPTIGVATFDGLDSIGKPYDQSGPNTFGKADVLESFPINLAKRSNGTNITAVDSLGLFFAVQPQGLGDVPEEQDSLVLQFYAPDLKEWRNIWSKRGTGIEEFSKHFIRILSPDYLKDGFKFRFVNYATLSGNFDHWHLDYVWLKDKFGANDSVFKDVSMVNQPVSYLEDYTQMPWTHFKTAPAFFMKKETSFYVRNLDGTAHLNQYFITGKDAHGTPISGIPSRLNNNFAAYDLVEENMPFNNFVFPLPAIDTADRFYFDMSNYLFSDPNEVKENDTARIRQVFGTYYSYSDGTMEAAYYLEGPGAKVAVEYNAALKDSLRAINIFIPQTRNNITNNLYQIKVWKSISPEEEIFSSDFLDPVYAPGRDRGIRFQLPTPIEIEGQFFVGIVQQIDPVYLGFDKNLPKNDKTYFNLGGVWTPSALEGRVMIQPDFGTEYVVDPSSVVSIKREKLEVNAYPNPVTDELYLNWENQIDRLEYNVFNIQGQKLSEGVVEKGNTLSFSQFNKGFYIIYLQSTRTNQVSRIKVLKTE